MVYIVDTVEDKIQNDILSAFDNNITPRNKLAVRSINASSRRVASCITANSERGERIGVTASLEILSEKNNTLHVLNTNDGTRRNTPVEVRELSVPGPQLDRQPHIHHTVLPKIMLYL